MFHEYAATTKQGFHKTIEFLYLPGLLVVQTYYYYLLVVTHHVRNRCPTWFGNLLLSCFDVLGSQIGSTESGNSVWTYENRCRPI